MSQFGPAYDQAIDGERLKSQRERILQYMLRHEWSTLAKIRHDLEHVYETNVPEASISAQLRHLKKPEFGGWELQKRRAGEHKKGLWEYRLRRMLRANNQPGLFTREGATL
jgi:hypothetical protein